MSDGGVRPRHEVDRESRPVGPAQCGDGIDFQNPSHVFREIENDGDVAALSGKRGATATRAGAERRYSRQRATAARTSSLSRGSNDADWDLAIVRAVGGIQGAAAVVETDFALRSVFEEIFRGGGVDFRTLCGSARAVKASSGTKDEESGAWVGRGSSSRKVKRGARVSFRATDQRRGVSRQIPRRAGENARSSGDAGLRERTLSGIARFTSRGACRSRPWSA